eukprot:2838395-Rhodomonas_salina.1
MAAPRDPGSPPMHGGLSLELRQVTPRPEKARESPNFRREARNSRRKPRNQRRKPESSGEIWYRLHGGCGLVRLISPWRGIKGNSGVFAYGLYREWT